MANKVAPASTRAEREAVARLAALVHLPPPADWDAAAFSATCPDAMLTKVLTIVQSAGAAADIFTLGFYQAPQPRQCVVRGAIKEVETRGRMKMWHGWLRL